MATNSFSAHTSVGSQTALIPRSVLFGNPKRIAPRISPDGTRLAWIAPDEGVLNVWVATLDTNGGIEDGRPVTHDRGRGIRVYAWAPDDEHLLYLQDQDGDENWRVYDVSLHTSGVRDLTPFDGVQARLFEPNLAITDRVLIGLNRDTKQLHDVYELDLATGDLVKVLTNPGLLGLTADGELRIRAGLGPTPDGGRTITIRDTDDQWRPVLTVGQADGLTTVPLGFSQDGSRLLVRTPAQANATRLVWIDAATGQQEVLADDPDYDIDSVVLDQTTRQPTMVSVHRERRHWHAVDASTQTDLDRLTALDGGDLSVVSQDRADRTWIVSYQHADGPTRSYLFDRTTGAARFLFSDRPDLPTHLAPVEPFSFTARDGLPIHGYRTFPIGRRDGLPTVLLVHGGPWARDTWTLNPEVQWLANRGYLCLQVNFRGSTGYGKAFSAAGDREWGGKMHEDLLDAVEWAIEGGYADPDRIGIYGVSYGGYAALVGAAFSPNVFRCAVDLCGPANLETLLRAMPDYWTPMAAELYARVGNPDTQRTFLRSRSPLSRVEAITTPLLIGQGANDPRVPQAESDKIVAALRSKDIPCEYLLFQDEGHGLVKPENRLRFYAAAERFLAHHLGGRCELEAGV